MHPITFAGQESYYRHIINNKLFDLFCDRFCISALMILLFFLFFLYTTVVSGHKISPKFQIPIDILIFCGFRNEVIVMKLIWK